MRRYELIEGTASKFWEVSAEGTNLTVTFGRIGTAGQSKTKDFDDAAAAIKERDKLIREKTGKGYVAIDPNAPASASALATLTAPVTPPGTASHAETEVKAAKAAKAAKNSEPAADAVVVHPVAAIVWPTGGFQWKEEWRNELAVVRGIHVPPMAPVALEAEREILLFDAHSYNTHNLFPRLASKSGHPWTYWGHAGSREHFTPDALAKADREQWLERLVQLVCGKRKDDDLVWVVRMCAHLHGLPFAIESVVGVWQVLYGNALYFQISDQLLLPLRLAIAHADEPVYAQALTTASALRDASEASRQACAYLFPHMPHWAEACEISKQTDFELLSIRCAVSAEYFERYLQTKGAIYFSDALRSAIYLQVLLHGEAVADAVANFVFSEQPWGADDFASALDLVARMHTPRLIPILVRRVDNKKVRDVLDKLVKKYPAAILKCAIEHAIASRDPIAERWAIQLAMLSPDALEIALAEADEKSRTRFQALLAALSVEEASPEQLPPLLREPPWLAKSRPQALAGFEMATLPTPQSLVWDRADLARARIYRPDAFWLKRSMADAFGLKPEGVQRITQGQPLQDGDLDEQRYVYATPDSLYCAPESGRLALWNSYPPQKYGSWSSNIPAVRAILLAYGEDALPGLLAYMKAFADRAPELAAMVDSPTLVDGQLHAMRFSKKHKEPALRWVLRFADTVLHKALPQAFHPEHSALRDNARHAIRWLAEQGKGDVAHRIAASYGDPMPEALTALLAMDPLYLLPGKMPKLPAFFVAAAMQRPQLASGGALPPVALEHIGTMLAISQPDAAYAGLAQVKKACTPASLAAFAWDVFQAWLTAGAPAKEGWAYSALGLLGDDLTARKLAPLIRAWPDQSAQARALLGLDVLARLGSDTALMHLNALSTSKCKPLVKRVAVLIADVAEARGLSTEELADRLVPDVGLDEAGTLELDFGPRRFYLRFDETLEPFVKDAQGLRLKVFPRQQKTDDAALATAAIERFKHIRKEARATASTQMARLERAMVAGRRWPAADFRRFFLEQPLMRHLTARLVWGVYGRRADAPDSVESLPATTQLQSCFRVAEDWTLADADDTLWQLPDDAVVGIPHVLQMPKHLLEAFTQTFADYEIAQPFRQLARETYALTDDEQQSDTITRFERKVVAIGSVMGLAHRGWERGDVQSSGRVMGWTRAANDGLQVEVQLDPGSVIGDAASDPRQRLVALVLRDASDSGSGALVKFERLDAMRASEVLRDLELLAHAKE